MKNSFIKAQLTSLKTFQVMVFTNVPRTNDISFTVFKDPKDEGRKVKIIRQSGSNLVNIFELELPENYEFGKQYYVGLLNLQFGTTVEQLSRNLRNDTFDILAVCFCATTYHLRLCIGKDVS